MNSVNIGNYNDVVSLQVHEHSIFPSSRSFNIHFDFIFFFFQNNVNLGSQTATSQASVEFH